MYIPIAERTRISIFEKKPPYSYLKVHTLFIQKLSSHSIIGAVVMRALKPSTPSSKTLLRMLTRPVVPKKNKMVQPKYFQETQEELLLSEKVEIKLSRKLVEGVQR